MDILPRTSDTSVSIRKTFTSGADAVRSVLTPRPANADSPAVIIGALGAIAAAGVAGAATIGAAVIIADGNIRAAEISAGTGGPIIAPGTPPTERSVGEQALPKAVRGFLHRDITVSAISADTSTGGDRTAVARASYRFDGDIRKAQPEVKSFTLQDRLTLRFEISNIEQSTDAPLTMTLDALTLSTIDVTDTDGHAAVGFIAVQGENVLWRWSARVAQGERPRIISDDGSSQRIVRQEKDLLIIRKLRAPIAYEAPGAGGTTVVDINMTVEGVGSRSA